MKHRVILRFYLILIGLIFISQVSAHETEIIPGTDVYVLTLETVNSGRVNWSSASWKYHPGDNLEWASPTFDDTAWESTSILLSPNALPEGGWQGIGWFRLHLSVADEQLWNMPLALHVVYQMGASEIYLDGKLIYKFGKVGTRQGEEEPYWERNPQAISFSGKTDHLIAVRYSNFLLHQSSPFLGFSLSLTPLNASIKKRVNTVRQGTTFQMVWTAISAFLMLQHLLLFIFYPRMRENLYFSILTGSIGTFVFFLHQFTLLTTNGTHILHLLQLLICVYVLMFLAALLFLYTLFYVKLPKSFWGFLIGWGVTLCVGLLSLKSGFPPISESTPHSSWSDGTHNIRVSESVGLTLSLLFLFTSLTFLEMARVIIVAISKKKDDAWIFGIGSFAPFILPLAYIFFPTHITTIYISWKFSALVPFFPMSVYLARNFARSRRQLETEVFERKLLAAENARKTEEFAAAHDLQVSMLPQTPPELPNLDVAFKMQPATEVGGDYYDYTLSENGRLTFAIGDATGHGMNAGLVVSAVKGLFKTSAQDADNLETLDHISQGIKSMNLKRLSMAMMLATVNHNTLTLTGAGMPPALFYIANENRVEEIFLEGTPLGWSIGSEREEMSYELHSGDTLLLMSDGLPEMLNPENEMLDYPKTKNLFTEVATQSPQAIIDHIFKASTSWANGKPQADDVTLVVIKVK
ncbi:SpoIIE family protein phosphatase [Candidatus Poribacteria bacterium]|nr:SpoIIE family protein phosphatase [Candidatus Poribacteria bacterium]